MFLVLGFILGCCSRLLLLDLLLRCARSLSIFGFGFHTSRESLDIISIRSNPVRTIARAAVGLLAGAVKSQVEHFSSTRRSPRLRRTVLAEPKTTGVSLGKLHVDDGSPVFMGSA